MNRDEHSLERVGHALSSTPGDESGNAGAARFTGVEGPGSGVDKSRSPDGKSMAPCGYPSVE